MAKDRHHAAVNRPNDHVRWRSCGGWLWPKCAMCSTCERTKINIDHVFGVSELPACPLNSIEQCAPGVRERKTAIAMRPMNAAKSETVPQAIAPPLRLAMLPLPTEENPRTAEKNCRIAKIWSIRKETETETCDDVVCHHTAVTTEARTTAQPCTVRSQPEAVPLWKWTQRLCPGNLTQVHSCQMPRVKPAAEIGRLFVGHAARSNDRPRTVSALTPSTGV